MQTFSVRSASGTYRILCGSSAINQLTTVISKQADATGVFVLSSPRVWKNCGRMVAKAIRSFGARAPILFGDAESVKSLATVEKVCRALHRAGADRRSVIVAVGGGVVGDVAGFVAASYLRGVRLIQVPTTLVAQIDSAIGGKTGVNLPEGKNLVGAFYPPVAIVADPRFLQTLPEAQFRSGLYEGVKYVNIVGGDSFAFLETNMAKVLRRDPPSLERLMLRSIRAKAEIVSKDEREAGLRQILNFGHTFGHALETAGNYRHHLHGEAVGWGMLVATLLALATNRINSSRAQRISRLVMSVGPLPSFDSYRPAKLLALMRGDKKSRGGRVRWVLPVAIGRVEWGVEIRDRLMIEAIREAPEVARLAQASQ
ncbi:MAG: 3-dehydroquinate synthase [Candidatus Acidiferrales bacterium]|jgi:3-dehydroquinate synthase